jgi:hypothetical protein
MAEGDDDEIQNMTDDEFERPGRDVAHNTMVPYKAPGLPWGKQHSIVGLVRNR